MSGHLSTTFKIDPTLDIAGYKQIVSHLHHIDWMSFTAPKSDSEVSSLVFEYHKDKKEEILQITNEVKEQWQKKESVFVRLAVTYFSESDFPCEVYTCYPTIWPLIARDPQNHLIAFPADSNAVDSCAIIAHEFLHELFFHHIYNKLGDSIDLNSKIIYDLSEVFNVLVLKGDDWQKEFPFEVRPYTEHIDLYNDLLPIWEKSDDLDNFINDATKKISLSRKN
jgi:hypothetical protein